MDATAHQPKGACHSQSIQYSPVVTDNVTVPSKYDALRPTVSATTPGRNLENHHTHGEKRVGGERLEVSEPSIEQKQGIDAPDERRCQGIAEHQRQVHPLNPPRAGVHGRVPIALLRCVTPAIVDPVRRLFLG